jgi:triacylglycerol lipase
MKTTYPLSRLLLLILLLATGRNVLAQDAKPNTSSQGGARAASTVRVAAAAAPVFRTSPFDPPDESDISYFTDVAPKLDTGCIFRSSGPIVYNVEIKRYLGELNPDGTLKNAAALVAAGLVSPTVKLIMPGFDVDSGASIPGIAPERDRISFNGEPLGFLSGENNQWVLNSFEVPIEKVKFSQRGASGGDPTGGVNEITIDIDTANSEEDWCTSVDWGSASFKAISPIILIHGNNSNGGFYDRQGFTQALRDQHLVYDNSINMATNTRAAHGQELDGLIPAIVRSFGAKSVHIIVHSKGGLDTRDYLANYQPGHQREFKVLSFTSLSSPHNGSVGADVLVAREDAANNVGYTGRVEFVGFPDYTRQLTAMMGIDAGTRDLTVGAVTDFNSSNIGRIGGLGITFNTVGGDADRNGNNRMDRNPDEYAELRAESASLRRIDNVSEATSRFIIAAVYQIMRNTSGVTVTYRTEGIFHRRVATITSIPNPSPIGNDTLVTIPSARGAGSLQSLVRNSATFTGGQGRNHSSIANAGVANTVIPWILDAERRNGGLR